MTTGSSEPEDCDMTTSPELLIRGVGQAAGHLTLRPCHASISLIMSPQ